MGLPIQGTRIVAPQVLLAIPDVPAACFRHWRRAATVPQAARERKPSQVQCTHSPGDEPGEFSNLLAQKEINPTSVGLISFWNPATSYSPGRFRPRCIRHRRRAGGNLTKYDVCTYLKMDREQAIPDGKEISPAIRLSLFLWNPATSYSPGPSPAKYHRR